MKTILTHTAIAVLAIANFGLAACVTGVGAKPQDAPGDAGSSRQAPAQTDSPTPQQTKSGDSSSSETKNGSGGVAASGVTVGPGDVKAPGVIVGPGGTRAPGTTAGSNGVTASAGSVHSADCEEGSMMEETGAVVRFPGHCKSTVIKSTGVVVEYDQADKTTIEGASIAVEDDDIKSPEITGDGTGIVSSGDVGEVTISGTGNAVTVFKTVGKVKSADISNTTNSWSASRSGGTTTVSPDRMLPGFRKGGCSGIILDLAQYACSPSQTPSGEVMKTNLIRIAPIAAAVTILGLSAYSVGAESKPAGDTQTAPTTQNANKNAPSPGNMAIANNGGDANTIASSGGSDNKSGSKDTGSSDDKLRVENPNASSSNSVVILSGHCDIINITDSSNQAIFESAGKVILSGGSSIVINQKLNDVEVTSSGNSVTVTDDLDEVMISGSGNTVFSQGVEKKKDTDNGSTIS